MITVYTLMFFSDKSIQPEPHFHASLAYDTPIHIFEEYVSYVYILLNHPFPQMMIHTDHTLIYLKYELFDMSSKVVFMFKLR